MGFFKGRQSSLVRYFLGASHGRNTRHGVSVHLVNSLRLKHSSNKCGLEEDKWRLASHITGHAGKQHMSAIIKEG